MSSPRPVPIAEVKALLEEQLQERDPELHLYEHKLALDHAQRTAKLPLEQTKKLIQELAKVENVNEYYGVKLADYMPADTEEVRALFIKERYSLTSEQVEQILEILAGYR